MDHIYTEKEKDLDIKRANKLDRRTQHMQSLFAQFPRKQSHWPGQSDRAAELRGPGNILGIKSRAMISTHIWA